jgi:MoxR-like ATPase
VTVNEQTLPFHPRTGEQLSRRTSAPSHIPYQYTDDIVIAVNAALSSRRPLLLRGMPGCGKSTLARDIAYALDRDYAEKVITSRTAAVDLLWTFDAVRRLSDTGPEPALARDARNYVEREILWDAFEPAEPSTRDAVILLDEIDKADPDVPNDLLVPLGERRFTVTDTRPPLEVEQTREVLVIITTNGERDLPPAFLRRCASLTLEDPSQNAQRIREIASSHLDAMFRAKGRPAPGLDVALLDAIIKRANELLPKTAGPTTRRAGTAEILDAFKTCIELDISSTSSEWKALTRVLMHKESGNPDATAAP